MSTVIQIRITITIKMGSLGLIISMQGIAKWINRENKNKEKEWIY